MGVTPGRGIELEESEEEERGEICDKGKRVSVIQGRKWRRNRYLLLQGGR